MSPTQQLEPSAQLPPTAEHALQTPAAHSPLQQSENWLHDWFPAAHCPAMQWSAPLQLRDPVHVCGSQMQPVESLGLVPDFSPEGQPLVPVPPLDLPELPDVGDTQAPCTQERPEQQAPGTQNPLSGVQLLPVDADCPFVPVDPMAEVDIPPRVPTALAEDAGPELVPEVFPPNVATEVVADDPALPPMAVDALDCPPEPGPPVD